MGNSYKTACLHQRKMQTNIVIVLLHCYCVVTLLLCCYIVIVLLHCYCVVTLLLCCYIASDIEVACYAYEGIDAVKAALKQGISMSTEEMPIKVCFIQNFTILCG